MTSLQLGKEVKRQFREKNSLDSDALFNASWRVLLQFFAQGDVCDEHHMQELYDSIVSEKVNNPRSKFYIYG